MVWAVLPLKDFVNAKQRLSGVLQAHERRRLFHCMVEDVLGVLSTHPLLQQTLIVSDDPSAELLAARYGVEGWSESALPVTAPEKGLSAVIGAVACRLQEQGVESMLVVHGDLPFLSESALNALIKTHQRHVGPAMTIAADSHGLGSNCLMLSPPNSICFQYGEGSYQKHCQSARAKGLAILEVVEEAIGWDIDSPDDLQALLNSTDHSKSSVCYLYESGIADRLRLMIETAELKSQTGAIHSQCGSGHD